jgi:hypothetical protein
MTSRTWLTAVVGVVTALVIVLGNHAVARSARHKAAPCTTTAYHSGQPIVLASVDGSGSTNGTALRTAYAQALSGIAAAASNQGAYLIITVFGPTIGNTKTMCATSTRVAGAAPLFVTSQQTALRQALDKVARRASRVDMGAAGSSVYGGLLDGIQRVQLLRAGQAVPARVVVLSDGDESQGGGLHLRRLLGTRASDQAIAARIIGTLPPPNARGLTSIQIEGVGQTGAGRPISTQGVRRMVHVWGRICRAAHPSSCLVTSDLLNNFS